MRSFLSIIMILFLGDNCLSQVNYNFSFGVKTGLRYVSPTFEELMSNTSNFPSFSRALIGADIAVYSTRRVSLHAAVSFTSNKYEARDYSPIWPTDLGAEKPEDIPLQSWNLDSYTAFYSVVEFHVELKLSESETRNGFYASGGLDLFSPFRTSFEQERFITGNLFGPPDKRDIKTETFLPVGFLGMNYKWQDDKNITWILEPFAQFSFLSEFKDETLPYNVRFSNLGLSLKAHFLKF